MTTQQYPQTDGMHTQTPTPPQPDFRRDSIHPEPHVVRQARETKPSLKTTEFWIMLAAVAGILVASYADSDSFSRSDGWQYVSFVVIGYLISRGLAKIATADRFDRD